MSFKKYNTVEQMILEAATSLGSGAGNSVLREYSPSASSLWIGMSAQQCAFSSNPDPK